MDDEDDITNKVVENTLSNLVREALYSEQWKIYIQSLAMSTMFNELQSLSTQIHELERKLMELDYIVNNSEYSLDKMYDADGKLHDVLLIKKQSDY